MPPGDHASPIPKEASGTALAAVIETAVTTERITTMAVRLNHTIVAARDKEKAALFLTEILGLPAPSLIGPFAMVQVSDDTSLDYHDAEGEIVSQHYAFLVDESEFDY